METVKIIHSLLRWAVLIFGLFAVLQGLTGVLSKRNFNGTDNKVGLFFMIFCDIQLLIGLVLYFGNSWFAQLRDSGAAVMKNASLRFFTVEHTLMMLIAWILVHVGRTAVKRAALNKKHGKMLIFYGIALLIIVASIPWPFREAIARPLYRGF